MRLPAVPIQEHRVPFSFNAALYKIKNDKEVNAMPVKK